MVPGSVFAGAIPVDYRNPKEFFLFFNRETKRMTPKASRGKIKIKVEVVEGR